MNVLGGTQGSYPEFFLLITLLEVSHEWGAFMGVLGGHNGFLTLDLEDRVILYVLNGLRGPKGSYPGSFVLLSSLEVSQE